MIKSCRRNRSSSNVETDQVQISHHRNTAVYKLFRFRVCDMVKILINSHFLIKRFLKLRNVMLNRNDACTAILNYTCYVVIGFRSIDTDVQVKCVVFSKHFGRKLADFHLVEIYVTDSVTMEGGMFNFGFFLTIHKTTI